MHTELQMTFVWMISSVSAYSSEWNHLYENVHAVCVKYLYVCGIMSVHDRWIETNKNLLNTVKDYSVLVFVGQMWFKL